MQPQEGTFFVYDKTPFKTMSGTTNQIPIEKNNCQNNIMIQNQQIAGFLPYGSGNSFSQLSYLTQLSQNSFSQMSEFNNVQGNIHSNHLLQPTSGYFREHSSQNDSEEYQNLHVANI